VGFACLKGAGQPSGDPACLWILGLTGLGGHGIAERKLCMCAPPAWQALGAQAYRVNTVQGCVGLGGVVSRMEIVHVCISSAAGLGGMYQQ
jgi:hypothetical protein